MSKVLILPDVHNRWEKAEKIISLVKPDKTVFLGDAFDDFNDDPHIIADTADWFHHSIHQKDRVHICGNHDLHYRFGENRGLRCSGFDQFKLIAINDFVKKEDWEKLVFFHVLNDKWLLSHGGVHPSWINPQHFQATKISQYTLKYVVGRLKNDSVDCIRKLSAGKHHWFAMPGFTRSYNSPYYGGITWCDWNKEFHPIRGINQIVGHTPNHYLNWSYVGAGGTRAECLYINGGYTFEDSKLSNDASYNLCLDSQPGSRFYAIYENGKLEIIDTTETNK